MAVSNKRVLIGVQARSTSTRLPGKSLEVIDTMSMVDHVLAACDSAKRHIEHKPYIECEVVLLIPKGDKLRAHFSHREIVEGPEHDVLRRYKAALDTYNPDYIVRITGDCPLIPPPIISKHILATIHDELDYCSNVYKGCRTYPNGFDCEVVSSKMLEWLDKYADTKEDREHVTLLISRVQPEWAKTGIIIGYNDLSDLKISVDLPSELEEIRTNKKRLNKKLITARRHGFVYRF